MRVTGREVALVGLIVLVCGAPGAAWAEEPASDAAGAPGPASTVSARAVRSGGPAEARSPGFETLADGSTRLSVELSHPVLYDTKAAPGRVTYVMKGARVARRNDYNPLVTVDFNTPVASARLMPHGRDLWFVVELRAAVTPEVKTDAAKDGGIVLQIEFPKGDYVVAAADPQPVDPLASESDRPSEPQGPAAGADSAPKPAASSRRRHSSH